MFVELKGLVLVTVLNLSFCGAFYLQQNDLTASSRPRRSRGFTPIERTSSRYYDNLDEVEEFVPYYDLGVSIMDLIPIRSGRRIDSGVSFGGGFDHSRNRNHRQLEKRTGETHFVKHNDPFFQLPHQIRKESRKPNTSFGGGGIDGFSLTITEQTKKQARSMAPEKRVSFGGGGLDVALDPETRRTDPITTEQPINHKVVNSIEYIDPRFQLKQQLIEYQTKDRDRAVPHQSKSGRDGKKDKYTRDSQKLSTGETYGGVEIFNTMFQLPDQIRQSKQVKRKANSSFGGGGIDGFSDIMTLQLKALQRNKEPKMKETFGGGGLDLTLEPEGRETKPWKNDPSLRSGIDPSDVYYDPRFLRSSKLSSYDGSEGDHELYNSAQYGGEGMDDMIQPVLTKIHSRVQFGGGGLDLGIDEKTKQSYRQLESSIESRKRFPEKGSVRGLRTGTPYRTGDASLVNGFPDRWDDTGYNYSVEKSNNQRDKHGFDEGSHYSPPSSSPRLREDLSDPYPNFFTDHSDFGKPIDYHSGRQHSNNYKQNSDFYYNDDHLDNTRDAQSDFLNSGAEQYDLLSEKEKYYDYHDSSALYYDYNHHLGVGNKFDTPENTKAGRGSRKLLELPEYEGDTYNAIRNFVSSENAEIPQKIDKPFAGNGVSFYASPPDHGGFTELDQDILYWNHDEPLKEEVKQYGEERVRFIPSDDGKPLTNFGRNNERDKYSLMNHDAQSDKYRGMNPPENRENFNDYIDSNILHHNYPRITHNPPHEVHTVVHNVHHEGRTVTHNIPHDVHTVTHSSPHEVHTVTHSSPHEVHTVTHSLPHKVHTDTHSLPHGVHTDTHSSPHEVNTVTHNSPHEVHTVTHSLPHNDHTVAHSSQYEDHKVTPNFHHDDHEVAYGSASRDHTIPHSLPHEDHTVTYGYAREGQFAHDLPHEYRQNPHSSPHGDHKVTHSSPHDDSIVTHSSPHDDRTVAHNLSFDDHKATHGLRHDDHTVTQSFAHDDPNTIHSLHYEDHKVNHSLPQEDDTVTHNLAHDGQTDTHNSHHGHNAHQNSYNENNVATQTTPLKKLAIVKKPINDKPHDVPTYRALSIKKTNEGYIYDLELTQYDDFTME